MNKSASTDHRCAFIYPLYSQDIEDEEADNGKYMELAKLADEKYPCRGYGSILRTIAKEEAVHHKHLKAILEDIHKNLEK